ncbi:MAG TPA: hypothetical protein VI306_18170 [Pyrinomonadaceae bacterium]
MISTKRQQSKRDVILETWNNCGAQSVGAYELKTIQTALKETLSIVESPASVARVLADEGIKLRHPEVLNFDSGWREQKLHELFGPGELEFETLQTAVDSINRIDELFIIFESEGDSESARAVTELVREVKSDLATRQIRLAEEVSGWLTVWLQNPNIFSDWLALRLNSPEFIKEFGEAKE